MTTIQKYHIKEIPSSPLTPLVIEKTEEGNNENGAEVLFEGTIIGTISQNNTGGKILRWHDVDLNEERESKRQKKEPAHKSSLLLLQKCPYDPNKTPDFFKNPFPFGTNAIQDLAMIGGEKFQFAYQLFHFWFGGVSATDRLNREIENVSMKNLSTQEIMEIEKSAKKMWVEAHDAYLQRIS